MRILVVSTSFPRSADDPCGHFVRTAAERLVASGHEVHVIAPGPRPRAESALDAGLVVHWERGGSLFAWPGALERLRRGPWRIASALAFHHGVGARLRSLGRFESVHAHWLLPTAWPVLARATRRGSALLATNAPIELFAHGADIRLFCRLPAALRARLCARWLERGARVHFASHSLRALMTQSLRASQAAALAHASDVEPPALYMPPRDELAETGTRCAKALGLRGDRPIVITASRIVRSKGLDRAARALERLPRPVEWLVIGDGPATGPLERRCRRTGLDVRIAGRRSRRETLALMTQAHVLLHPSVQEAAPTAVREARLLGLPVVACDAGDVGRWAGSDPGIFLCAAHPRALAEALERALARVEPAARTRSNPWPPEERTRSGLASGAASRACSPIGPNAFTEPSVTKPNDSSRDPVLEVHEESDEEPQAASGAAEHSPEAPSGAEHAEQEAEPPKARYTVDFDLTLESATYFWAGSAMNLSRGGFFVATHILQDIGERFKFTIRLPETSSIVKGIGEVRWHRPKDESEEAPAGMGIRFVELEAGAAEAIEDYLAPRAPIRWDAS